MSNNQVWDERTAPRLPIRTKVNVKVQDCTIDATSVNISETGIRFNATDPLEVTLQLRQDPGAEQHPAKLVWAKRLPDGSMDYGFEYDSAAHLPTAPDDNDSPND